MNAITDILRGELERLFDLDQMKKLSHDLLGFDPEDVGGTSGKAAFARSLVDRCAHDDSLEALADAILLSAKNVDDRVRQVFEGVGGEELKPGAVIAAMRVLKKIGEGGIGVVYLAERKEEGDAQPVRVALKVVRPEYARDRSAVKRYLTVSRVLRTVKNANLSSVLAVGVLEDGRPWVATQFVEGQTLSSRIQRTGPLHFNEARPVMRGVLAALEALHSRGLVHGDVKTENVFTVRPVAQGSERVEPTGVLVDGGSDRLLARGAVTMDRTGVLPLFGTAKAMAPEQARGRFLEPRSDIYAAGALLFEILTGKPPFSGDSPIDVVVKHLGEVPEAPSKLAPRGWVARELDALVLKALAKDPKARFQTAAEMNEALESVIRATSIVPPKPAGAFDRAAFDKARAALAEKPADEERQVALERVCEPAGEWVEAAKALIEIADATEELETKKALLFRVARIEEAERKDYAGAEAAYKKILEADATDEIAQIGVEEIRRASGNTEGLVELLLEKIEKEDTAAGRASILREIAQLYEEKLSQPDNAFVAWVQALSEDPRDEKTQREIERLADTPDKWNEALQSLSQAVQAGLEPAAAAQLYVLMGRWYADKLARPDFAHPCFSQALVLEPSNDAALEGVIGLYRKAQTWPDLVNMLVRRAEVASNPARARDYRADAAEVMYLRLGDSDKSAGIFRQIIEADPAHPKAAECLEKIYTEKKQFGDLVKLLEGKAKNEHGENRVATLTQIAEIYEDRLADHDQAAVHYEQALGQEPRNVVALKGLERLYAKLGKMSELLANLRTQLELAPTPRQRIGLYERIGAILEEEFVDHAKAAEAFEEVVKVDPGHDGANTALARLYRHVHRFDDLAITLDRHAKAATDPQRKIDLLLGAVKVLMVDVGAPERAVATCERVLAIDASHSEALELLARLKTSSGDVHAALDAVEKLAETERNPAKKADLFVRAGKILEERGDNDRAIARYKAALDVDGKCASAVAALRMIYGTRGDAHGAAELLHREIEITEGVTTKAKLLAELGATYRERLHEPAKAKEAFAKALALDPTCTPAARGLGEMSFEEKSWADAARYLEPLLARMGELPRQAARDISVMAGDALRELKQFDKAQRAYLNAKAFAADDREVLERVADVTFDSGAADEAAELYRDVMERFRAQLVGGDKGRILYRLGEASRRAGDHAAAVTALNEAAELMPGDAAPLLALRQVYEARGQWEEVVRTLRRRMERAEDEERFALLVDAGDILADKLGDKQKASKSYVAALEIRADDRNLLTKLMAVYSEAKDWSRLVEVLLRIAELVDDPKQLGKYYNTAAAISHQELGRLDEAASYYEQALDNDPSLKRAFEGLVAALTQKQSWQKLEDAYRGQIKRTEATATTEQKAHLWDSLAEILQHRLNKIAEAVEAYEEAQKLDPENRRRGELLSDIYAREPKRYFQKAVAAQNALLKKSPYRVESYQALRKLYTEVKKADESWCACQALKCLNMAEPDEEAFFKKHRTRKPIVAKERFHEEQWTKLIVHEEQDPLLTAIFAIIQPAVIGARSQTLDKFGVTPQHKRNAETDPAAMAQMLHYAAGVTGIALPDVYYRESDPGGLSFLFTNPAAIGLGKGALQGGPPQALAFVAARHLSYMRPGHYLRHLVPTGSGLRSWLLAAIKTATPQFPIPKDLEASVGEHSAAFTQHLTGPQVEQLRSVVHKLLAAAPELDMKRWVASVDLTADRVGLVLANDLEIATAIVRASPEDAAAATQKDRLKELYLYSVSEDYLSLRHKLGIAIGD